LRCWMANGVIFFMARRLQRAACISSAAGTHFGYAAGRI
jgi:hypothetical protein